VVDAVVVFEEETPLELIKAILPDVMVKGGDYTTNQVVGGKEVIANGGKVIINPIVEGFSTTSLIDKMKG
jgi:D-beta-D-heptose 7-phosphate kinase/D-beta-D-heptose 1-phosphate adenosyltransferase